MEPLREVSLPWIACSSLTPRKNTVGAKNVRHPRFRDVAQDG